jgi:glyoxylase-like metal-dependent hydrolase (beta-lactamase superfamily II)
MKPQVTTFFDEATFTATHVVVEPDGSHAAIVDSVLDFDPKSGRTSTASADEVLAFVAKNGLTVDWILETHAHADHLTAAPYLKEKLGAKIGPKIGIGDHITVVQETFKGVFNTGDAFRTDGSQFDHMFKDGETFSVGALEISVMHTPGHTPACVSYLAGDAVFVGDTLFMPDYGTARCDFPGGDAATLYKSIHKILSLPPETRVFLCHDYKAPPERDDYVWETTVAAERAGNIHVHEGVSEAEFVKMRSERDATLDMPVLILPSVQVNMRAGQFPPAEDNGVSYLKLPLNML